MSREAAQDQPASYLPRLTGYRMSPKVYCAFIEVDSLPGSEIDPTEVAGAAVRCYVRAEGPTDAEERCKEALREDRFKIVDVQWCVADDEVEWEHPDDAEGLAHVREAGSSDEVVYGEFHTWSHDAAAVPGEP